MQIEKLTQNIKSTIKMIKLQKDLDLSSKSLNVFAKKIKQITSYRATFIDANGKVLSDSNWDNSSMDNHQFRPEILSAKNNLFGVNIRHSKTLDEDFLYVAHEYKVAGKEIFLRLSSSTNQIKHSFMGLWKNIMFIFISAFVLIIIISYFLNAKIEKEIKKIILGLQDLANKEYKIKIHSNFAKEFVYIGHYIYELGQKLAKRDKQKRKHAAKLKLINAQRSQIISAISHEFKNPIASIMGYASTLLDDGDANETIRRRFLTKIVTNSQKITTMIDRLSLSTKLENGDLKPNISTFRLDFLAQDVVDGFKTRFPSREFITDLSPCEVKADSAIIEMVLTNLLDNALKYTSLDITIKVKNANCEIIDKGEGIDADEIQKITKKFYRSNKHTWDNSIGLGLSLVSYMLKLHNSKLLISSKMGKGSTFSFSL